MLTIALQAALQVATLLNTKESRKYADQILELKRDYNEEIGKPENEIDNGKLDFISRELRIVWEAIQNSSKG